MTAAEPDEILIRRAQDDPAAFEPLYERYLPQIYAYAYYRTGNAQEAEDLTARTFVQALTHLGRYSSRGVPFSAWLFRIVHNLVANWHRDRGRRPTFPLEAALDIADPGDSLHDEAANREEFARLWAAIRQLPPERQQVLVLKFVDGLPSAQIALIMGRSEGAVKALLHRTLVTLRRQLRPAGEEESRKT